MLGLMWIIELLDLVSLGFFSRHGIHPRSMEGLWGILFAPFLHANFRHLLANSVPFIVLGGIVLIGGRAIFWAVTVFVILLGGFGVWLIAGSNSNHIGASGLIFGYLGFLLARGFFERSPVWIVVAVLILIGYGGMLAGLLPIYFGVSWQSHLCGFLAGLAAARVLVSPGKKVIAKPAISAAPAARALE